MLLLCRRRRTVLVCLDPPAAFVCLANTSHTHTHKHTHSPTHSGFLKIARLHDTCFTRFAVERRPSCGGEDAVAVGDGGASTRCRSPPTDVIYAWCHRECDVAGADSRGPFAGEKMVVERSVK